MSKSLIKKVKYAFFDMDGTLLNSNKELTNENLEALFYLQKHNIKVSIATGRPLYMIKKDIDKIPINLPIIACNGAIVYDSEIEKVVSMNFISKSSANVIYSTLMENKATFVVITDKQLFRFKFLQKKSNWFEWIDETINNLEEKFKFKCDDIDNKTFDIDNVNVIKFLIIKSEMETTIVQNIQTKLENKLNDVYFVSSQEKVLDIMPQNFNKGDGLKKLHKKKIINLDETIVFGDADNDIEMFKEAKYSVAMGQANSNVKKFSTFETKSNDENGVAIFIKLHF